ncbi:Tex family protein [Estrella lausannensis]|uniref:Putative transcriptional accessory factor n=1 Tax=Estrella lausannensis TaxID=483423 RepID=A0A0H5DNX3_9BACT|nr:Tex family protein [Estrella lausannensis]CRX37558.1 Putative transcriptional accessory factor [Estrella lausannensis]
MNKIPFEPVPSIAEELSIPVKSVLATVLLLKEGNTIPFIARYRKEMTHNLDELELRKIEERLAYLTELHERKETIIASIESQGKLTDALLAQISSCQVKTELEDIYLPYKPKRRTRAQIAREKGLEPLAERMLSQPFPADPSKEAAAFIDLEKGVATIEEALAGARDIAAEASSENINVRSVIRDLFSQEGMLVSKEADKEKDVEQKFAQYYDFQEKISKIPSHRYLAIRRGENEGVLRFHIEINEEAALSAIQKLMKVNSQSPYAKELAAAIEDAFSRLLKPSIETDLRVELKMQSDRQAVDVFASNLRNVLMAAPLGTKTVIGIDPGIRTGCKCASVDETGKFLDYATVFLSQGERALAAAKESLRAMIKKTSPFAIAVGNGTYGRETESFVRAFLKEENLGHIILVSVSESGASVYSASDTAREEFPDLDLTIRGAISIARRLQDPLAELVKVDPKSIGVGQYQHDVFQPLLHDKLKEVVESCVNSVGVEVNTASASLLTYVSGIGPTLATKIVKHREKNGPFKSRNALKEVSGLGPKTFEQAAGFLRVSESPNPLDKSAVHPERYELVEKIAQDQKVSLEELMRSPRLIDAIPVELYLNTEVGIHTLSDIISELKKPGRDPRALFEPPCFRDDVQTMNDLKPGMKLEGIVTNVTAFGAFVDIGVHQDGLVHISEITDRYIKDPSEVLQVGDKIKVEVLQVEPEKKRISLSAKKNRDAAKAPAKKAAPKQEKFSSNPFASL